jgi:hypothetical protein
MLEIVTLRQNRDVVDCDLETELDVVDCDLETETYNIIKHNQNRKK